MTNFRSPLVGLAALLLLSLGACGSATTSGGGTLVVTGVAPGQTLLCSSGQGGPGGNTVIVLGTGFLSEHGTDVAVLWTATDSTPFEGGTSATTETAGTVLSDTQIEVAIPPATGQFTVIFTVTLPGGNSGSSEPQSISIGGVLVGPFGILDNYTATGNVLLTIAADQGVLENDIPVFCAEGDFEGQPEKPAAAGPQASHTPFVVTSADTMSSVGGTVAVNADGSFTYDPPAGFIGPDSFNYEFEQDGRPGSGTARIVISDMVWFIDMDAPSGGTGTLTSPFDDLGDFRAIQGGGEAAQEPDVGHTIFIYDQGDNDPYDGGLTLLDDQRLFGEGFALDMGSGVIVPAAGRPVLVNGTFADGERPGDIVITLADRNEVRGLDIDAPATLGIFGDGVTGPCTIDEVGIRGTFGNGIHLQDVTGIFVVGNDAPTASPSVTIRNGGNTGIFFSGVGGTPALTAGLTGITTLNVFDVLIDGMSGTGIDVVNANVDVRNSNIDACQNGIALAVFAGGTCTFDLLNSEIGVNAPMRFRGVVLSPNFGGINATLTGSEMHANDNALFAGNFSSSGGLVIALDTNVFQCLVTGPIYAVNLRGDFQAPGNTVVTALNDNNIIGNGQGGGLTANSVVFDADLGTAGEQALACGTSLFGQGGAARIEDTTLLLSNCQGVLDWDSLTIWQVLGDPSGMFLSGGVVVNATSLAVDVAP